MHRDGAYWKLAQLPDLITCDDPFFRPVALTNGPDGCIYIVDWYNKIISHNEVPRAHPDRDKTRGRIWRVKAEQTKSPQRPHHRLLPRQKQIPVREAYDREFERFLVRMFLERQPDFVAKFLDSEAAAKLPVEARVLASLALEPKASASRVAKLLPQLDRAPNDEELLRLAQFPAEPGVGEALQSAPHEREIPRRRRRKARRATHEARCEADRAAVAGNREADAQECGRPRPQSIAGPHQRLPTHRARSRFDRLLKNDQSGRGVRAPVLNTLRDLRSAEADLFASLAQSDPDPLTRDAALEALAASRAPDAGTKLLALYPSLQPPQRRSALNALSSSKAGAKTIVTALLDKNSRRPTSTAPPSNASPPCSATIPPSPNSSSSSAASSARSCCSTAAKTRGSIPKITLEGPFTVEAWVRLAPGIGNEDDILGTANGVEMNFFGSKFRVLCRTAAS
jgi:hypothetical protein